MRLSILVPALALGLAAFAAPASAIVMDGQLDPEYGTPVVVQTAMTQSTDATSGLLGGCNGGELDAAYAAVDATTLYLFVAGNLRFEGNPVEYGALYTVLHVFVDTGEGGQGTLNLPVFPYTPHLNGLTFDAGMSPSRAFDCVGSLANYYDPSSAYTLSASLSTLSAGGGGSRVWLGSTGAGGPGTLSGGTNPDGVEVAIDNRNVAGVTSGCATSSGEDVGTGIEWAIPLSALGNPTQCLKVSVVMTRSYWGIVQALGPLPLEALCTGGVAATTDFSAIGGNQFFTICPPGVPVHRATWGSLKTLYR